MSSSRCGSLECNPAGDHLRIWVGDMPQNCSHEDLGTGASTHWPLSSLHWLCLSPGVLTPPHFWVVPAWGQAYFLVLERALRQRRKMQALGGMETVCMIASKPRWARDVRWGLSSICPWVYVKIHWDLLEWAWPQSGHSQLIVFIGDSVCILLYTSNGNWFWLTRPKVIDRRMLKTLRM